MVRMPPSSVPCAVLDASAMIALCAKEPSRYTVAQAEVNRLAGVGCLFYAPNIIIGEALYVLRRKLTDGALTAAEHVLAVRSLQTRMAVVLPPPSGESSLIRRASQICDNYGASRSNDSLYIALAEQLGQTCVTHLLTFDRGLPNQAARNAPTVSVHLLT